MSIGDYVSSIAWTLPLLVLPLASAEHHGRVKFGGVPIPGVTVTASQADKKVSTITDAQGLYSFPDIAEGSWTIKVEMQGFSPAEKDVAVASGGPGADWELKMLRLDEMNAQAQPGSVSLTLNVPVATPSSAQSNKKAERPPANSENFQSTDLNAVNPTVDLSAPASEAFRDLDPRDKYFRASLAAIYVSDDWRIHPGLTLNWGLRWEYSSPITELYGRLVNLDIAPGFAAVAAVVAANPVGPLTGQTYPNSLIHPDRNNLAPRVGFAWRPFSASSMVVRGGYGIYYDTSVYHPIATLMAQQSPLSTSLRVENSPSNPLTLADGFKASSEITENTFALDPRLRIGYSQNWQLSVQRDLPRGRGGRTE